ncbi:hypothetical protein [Tissierella sp. Yu-01]|nr:hypothetical protein [Tissierella sp. Yu-01]WFA10362.1 hypothetical protein P3962_07360 [Tissierella sp. Yu-01]
MNKDEQKKITTTVDEAARLLKENPTWTYKQAIEKARESIPK